MKIGFIGLGNMGAPMAKNLVKAGHEVTGFDLNFEQARLLKGICNIVETATDATVGQDVVITMLPNGAALNDVAGQILPVMAPPAFFIDCSTVDIQTTKKVAMMIESAGLRGLDAPVSGGVSGASAGTLTFMVGGDANALELARPLFDIMGGRVIHCGDAGAGQAAKICNNMILGATMIVTCESFALADQLGLDRDFSHSSHYGPCAPVILPYSSYTAVNMSNLSEDGAGRYPINSGGDSNIVGSSTHKLTENAFGFGTSTREVAMKTYISPAHLKECYGRYSPSPDRYTLQSSLGRQVLDSKMSYPSRSFGLEERFDADRRDQRATQTPGPGSYRV